MFIILLFGEVEDVKSCQKNPWNNLKRRASIYSSGT